jgi:hypothetical protein
MAFRLTSLLTCLQGRKTAHLIGWGRWINIIWHEGFRAPLTLRRLFHVLISIDSEGEFFLAVTIMYFSKFAAKCSISADNEFGPFVRCSSFDFTLKFEQLILEIGISTIFLLLVPLRLRELYGASIKTLPSVVQIGKLVSVWKLQCYYLLTSTGLFNSTIMYSDCIFRTLDVDALDRCLHSSSSYPSHEQYRNYCSCHSWTPTHCSTFLLVMSLSSIFARSEWHW